MHPLGNCKLLFLHIGLQVAMNCPVFVRFNGSGDAGRGSWALPGNGPERTRTVVGTSIGRNAVGNSMEALGPKIRKQRRRLGLPLDELAGRTSISKPYLSLIETGRVTNPPSDEKLRRLEQALGFTPSE